MTRRITVRALLALAAGVLAPATLALPAQASLAIDSFSITPSTAQAGGAPDLTVDAAFSSRDGDTPKDATISLAPGLLANPTAAPACPTADFDAGWCPDQSHIGTGFITGTAPEFAFTLSLPTDAYLIQPQGSEPARIGLIVTFFDFPVATQSAPVSIRTTPSVGLDLPLMGLPNDIDGVPVTIDALHLKIFGTVGGTAFTRNPTSCSSATSTLTVDSYEAASTDQRADSSFTPTGCEGLPYSPTVAGTVTKDSGDDGIGLTATVTQSYDEADSRSIELTLPFSASPRLSVFAAGCTNADLTTCPAVGTATITTPLLRQPLSANVALVAHQGALPTLAIMIPAPIGLTLTATPILTGSSVQALVSNIPDVPITKLTLNLPGGADSLFRAGIHLCTEPQSFGGTFTGWNGATADPTAAAAVYGCPGGATAPTAAAARLHAARTTHAKGTSTVRRAGSDASVPISSFSISPSTTQAGSNPDLTVMAQFAPSNGDSIADATIELAPGLLADPRAPTVCSSPDFAAQSCPSSSKIGDGTITGTATEFGTTVTLPVSMYLIAPVGSELGRIGVIANFFDSPVATLAAPVQLRTTPSVGLNIPLSGIPNQVAGTAVQIDGLTLHLYGTVNGRPFTRNPTSCTPADTTLTIDSHDSSTPVISNGAFTPAGCSTLGYAPKLSAGAIVGSAGVALSTTITQDPADAATRSVEMTLPAGLSPRLTTLLHDACRSATDAGCPAIGTATVATPLLAAPATGRLIVVTGSGLPSIDAVFPAPLGLTLTGTPSLAGGRLSATFANIPDVPIASLKLQFADSVFGAGGTLCSAPQTLAGSFVAHSGAIARPTAALAVSGCKQSVSGSHKHKNKHHKRKRRKRKGHRKRHGRR